MTVQVGDKIKLEEETIGWYKGIIVSSNKKGIFPGMPPSSAPSCWCNTASYAKVGDNFPSLEMDTDVILMELHVIESFLIRTNFGPERFPGVAHLSSEILGRKLPRGVLIKPGLGGKPFQIWSPEKQDCGIGGVPSEINNSFGL
jgi:hypothetical protein